VRCVRVGGSDWLFPEAESAGEAFVAEKALAMPEGNGTIARAYAPASVPLWEAVELGHELHSDRGRITPGVRPFHRSVHGPVRMGDEVLDRGHHALWLRKRGDACRASGTTSERHRPWGSARAGGLVRCRV